MHVYTITNFNGETIAIHGTLAEAHADAKRRDGRTDLTIYLRDVPIDKASMVELLRAALLGDEYSIPGENLGEWLLTERGGLHRIKDATI